MEHFFQAFTQVSQKLWTRSHRLAVRRCSILVRAGFHLCLHLPSSLSTWRVSSSRLSPGCDPRTRRSCGVTHHPALPSVASLWSCCSLVVAGELCSRLLQGHMGGFGWKWGKLHLRMPCGAGAGVERRAREGDMGIFLHPSWDPGTCLAKGRS